MSKEKKNIMVPELRFPEFENDGEWKQTLLGQISEIVRGGSPRPIEEYLTLDSDGLNWLKIGDISSESKYITSTKEKVIPAALSKTREVNPEDLILSNSMSFGRPYILKIKTCIHDGWIAITQISDWVSKDYLYYFILTPASQVYFLNYSAGSGVQNLNADIIKLLQVAIPKNSEQQKIASCLSSLDDLITAHTQKLDVLKAHKKGLMQQLFPAEGEKVPKLRFEEFRESGEWEDYPLSQFIESLDAGVSVNSGDRPASSKEIGILKTSCVTNGIFEPAENKVVLDKIEIDRVQESVKGNTIIISRMNTPALVGANAFIEADISNLYLPDRLWAAKPKSNVNMKFIAHILGSIQGRKALSELASGSSGSMKNISKFEVLQMRITTPDPVEQQKIATCLSSLDVLIKAQAERIAQLKMHKKGLMQGLFPNIKENNS